MDIHKSKRPSLGSSKETSIDQKVSACTAAPRTPCINIPTHCFSMTGARMVVFSPTSLCGVLVFDSVSGRRLCLLRLLHFVNHQLCHTQLCQPPSLSHTTLSTTICHTHFCQPPSFTHNFVNHHLSHTQLCHTQLCQPPSVNTTLSTTICHTLSHTSLSTTIFHTQLCHTTLSHTTLSTTICHPDLCQPPSFTHNFVTHNFVNHHLSHTTFTIFVTHHLCRGTYGTGLALVARAALCVAGVALGHIHLRFTWQAWHLETSTFVLRGRRGTYGIGLALVARLDWISRR